MMEYVKEIKEMIDNHKCDCKFLEKVEAIISNKVNYNLSQTEPEKLRDIYYYLKGMMSTMENKK